jgi:hypothetical protein
MYIRRGGKERESMLFRCRIGGEREGGGGERERGGGGRERKEKM